MVPVRLLSPGMRVKIVDQWNGNCCQNIEGLMDKYLGQIVTVAEISGGDVFIEEDRDDENQRWFWNSYCFDYIVEDEPEDFEPASESEFLSFLFGSYTKGGEESMKYKVMCCKYGYAEVTADSAEEAEEIAQALPDSAYTWEGAEDHEAVEQVSE